jgi:hypothetical protein
MWRQRFSEGLPAQCATHVRSSFTAAGLRDTRRLLPSYARVVPARRHGGVRIGAARSTTSLRSGQLDRIARARTLDSPRPGGACPCYSVLMLRISVVFAGVFALAGIAFGSPAAAQAPAKPPAAVANPPLVPSAPAPTANLRAAPTASAPSTTASNAQAPTAKPSPPQPKNDYRKSSAWLCRPGLKGACGVDLTTTVVAKDGTLTREEWSAERKPAVDCFYVYPTVSNDKGGNSDMKAGPEEKNVIAHQFARFGSRCRLFAPLYRQVTLPSLRAAIAGKPIPTDRELGYNDIVDAWNDYLARDNQGRGVILIGHSQGARVLSELLANQIDGKPVQSQIISALLMGTSVSVPNGEVVGGTFKHMPLCRANGQTGCIISYASFRANAPPPPNSRFGKAADGQVAACTNPAALAGGSGELHAYLGAKPSITSVVLAPQPWAAGPQRVTTEFASVPGLLTGECVANANGSYLAVSVHGDPQDARVDDIVGDIVRDGQVLADWGLHMIDVNLAMGNLLDVVSQQTSSYLAKTSAPATQSAATR